MKNYINDSQIPMGLGMALAQNSDALNYFSSLSKEEQQKIIDHTHTISSSGEMQAFVNSLPKTGDTT